MSKMDKQSNSTTAPEISTLVMGTSKTAIAYCLTAEELQKLSMEELRTVLAFFTAMDEMACAFLNQARFAEGNTYNAAGDIADALLDHLTWCVALIEQVAKDAKTATRKEAEDRAWLLIQRAADYSENLADFVAVAAQLSVEASEVEAA